MADTSRQSVPDKTNMDNASKTGIPKINSQGRDVAVKGGTAKQQRAQSDAERNPNNRTVRYGSDQNAPLRQSNTRNESDRQFLERHVVEAYGPAIRLNPQFDSLVKNAKKQIDANRLATEGM